MTMNDTERCALIEEAKTLSAEELAAQIAILNGMLPAKTQSATDAIEDRLAVYEGEVYARDEGVV